MEQAIKYSNTHIGIVDKKMRKAIVLFANKSWQKAYDLLHFNNKNKEDKNNREANLFTAFAKLYCAAQLENSTTEQDAYVLLTYTNFEFWPYLEEHNFPRYARRFACHFLAYLKNDEGNYTEALDFVDEALSINSPIDDLDDVPLYEQKISILLTMKNMESAYFSIQKLLKVDAENETFITIINTEDYKIFLTANNLENLAKGIENETAKEALDRYTKFLNLNFKDTIWKTEDYLPNYFRKVKLVELEEVEQRLDFKFPSSYRDFVLKNGLFKLGRWNDYESSLLKPLEINTLHNELERQWNSSFVELSKEDLEATKKLICFSYGDESLQATWYYCFDKRTLNPETGEMNVYAFNQDEWQFEASEIYTDNSFNTHISSLVDEKIEGL